MMPHPNPDPMGDMFPEGMPPGARMPEEFFPMMRRKLTGCEAGDIECRERTVMEIDESVHREIGQGRYEIDPEGFPAWDEYRERYLRGWVDSYKKSQIISMIELARGPNPQEHPRNPQFLPKPIEAHPILPHMIEPQSTPIADGIFSEIPPEDPNMFADILANLAEIPKMFFEPKRLPSGLPPHCYDMAAQGQPLPPECLESKHMKPQPPMMTEVREEHINEDDLLRQEREEEVGIVDNSHKDAVVSQAGENEWAKARDEYLGGKAMNYKTEIAAIVTKHKVKPVDCKMTDWSPWTECLENADGTWAKTKNRNVLVKPQHGGKDCPTNQDTKNCPPIDCKYEKWSDWSECELAHTEGEGIGIQSRHRDARMPANGGTACDSTLQYEERECSMPSETVVEPTVAMEVIAEPVAVVEAPTIVSAIVGPLVEFVQLFTPGTEAIVAPVISDTSTVQQEVIPVQTGLPAEPASPSVSLTSPQPVAEVKPATIDTPEDEAKEEEVAAKVEPVVEEKKSTWPWVVGGLAVVGGGYYFVSKRK